MKVSVALITLVSTSLGIASAINYCGRHPINIAKAGCCYTNVTWNEGYEVIDLATEGCCMIAPGISSKVNTTAQGCCNTRLGGLLQEVIDLDQTACCGPDMSETVQRVRNVLTEQCCHGIVIPAGRRCPPAKLP